MHDVIVIGGGIAGLTAAWRLRRDGRSVLVLEEQAQPGGNIRTIGRDGFRMEIGPHSFMGSSENVWRLIDELDMEEAVEPAGAASKNRYIYRDGRLLPLPMDPLSFLRTPLLSARAKLRLCAEPLIPNGARDSDTAWDFFRRRFGEEAATYIMSPFVSGIYAGDVRRLGARAAFEKFWRFERESGSMILGAVKYMRRKRKRLARSGGTPRRGLYTFRGGLGRITDRLARDLGEGLCTGVSVERIEARGDGWAVRGDGGEWSAPAVVVAVPPHRAADILAGPLPEIEKGLRSIPMAPVALVHWSPAPGEDGFPDGFGFLMPRLYPLRVLGTIFASRLFTGRAPEGHLLFSSFYGGMQDPEAAALPAADLEALVHREHREIFGNGMAPPRILEVLRYPGAIPQLLPGHPEIVAGIEEAMARTPGLFTAGNYLTGVGMEHAVQSGFRAAAACGAYLKARSPGGAS
jgi:oxygen-dependent protoporphyrinogen oxidase